MQLRHAYYSAAAQSLEERLGSETAAPDRQHVWGLGGTDEIVARDRATPAGVSVAMGAGSSTLDERL